MNAAIVVGQFWDFRISDLMAVATALVVGGGAIYALQAKVHILSNLIKEMKLDFTQRMVAVEAEMKQMVAVMITQGRHEERMNAMDSRILAQGKRLDDTMASQTQALERMARMIESTVSRVNKIADDNMRYDEERH